MRFNVFFKFKAADNSTAMLPSSKNPVNANNLAECMAGLVPNLPDYTPVGIAPVGIIIESLLDPILTDGKPTSASTR